MAIKKVETQDGHRWRVRLYLGRDADGKRQYHTATFDLKKDAEAEETRLKRQKQTGGVVRPSREGLASYLEAWLDNVKAPQVRETTLYGYRSIVRRYVKDPPEGTPRLGKVPIRDLNAETLQELYGHMYTELGLSPRTIRRVHALIRQCLSYAVETGALFRNPTDAAKPPRRPQEARSQPGGQIRAMDRDEAARFLEAARGDRYEALWLVLVTGGLRPGEALALLWQDVDLEDGKLHVRRTLARWGIGGGWKLQKPKTARARRVVVLPDRTAAALRAHRKRQLRERLKAGPEYQDQGFVFATVFGKPLHRGNLSRRRYRDLLEAAKLGTYEGEGKDRTFRPGFRLYDLRHTCATLLLLAGEHAKVVSERLGHASIALTLDTYSHVLPSMQEQAAAKLEEMFGEG